MHPLKKGNKKPPSQNVTMAYISNTHNPHRDKASQDISCHVTDNIFTYATTVGVAHRSAPFSDLSFNFYNTGEAESQYTVQSFYVFFLCRYFPEKSLLLLYGHFLHDLRSIGFIHCVPRLVHDLVRSVQTLCDLSESSVLSVEMRSILYHDEELGTR